MTYKRILEINNPEARLSYGCITCGYKKLCKKYRRATKNLLLPFHFYGKLTIKKPRRLIREFLKIKLRLARLKARKDALSAIINEEMDKNCIDHIKYGSNILKRIYKRTKEYSIVTLLKLCKEKKIAARAVFKQNTSEISKILDEVPSDVKERIERTAKEIILKPTIHIIKDNNT